MVGRLLLAGVLAAGLAWMMPAAPADARQSCGVIYLCTWTYYDPNAPFEIVGGQQWQCNGQFTQWGTQTPIVQYTQQDCA
jgi:hypothetical protein